MITVARHFDKRSLKILIVKRDKIGDMLLTTPLLSQLREALPDAQIDVLANDYNAWVLDGHSAVNRVWVYRRARHGGRLRLSTLPAQLLQQFAIRQVHYDAAIAANGEPSPRAIGRVVAAGARQTIAYADNSSRRERYLTTPLPVPEGGHEIERLLGLAVPLQVCMPAPGSIPRYTVPMAWAMEARAWLDDNGFTPKRYLVVSLATRYAATQPQPQQVLRWAKWVKLNWNWDTAIHYTPGPPANAMYPGSELFAQAIASNGGPYVRLIPPRISPSIAIVGLAGGSICPDGGLMHFAAISPGGVVALFAANATGSSSKRWGPRGHCVAVIDAKQSIADVDDAEILLAMLKQRDSHFVAPRANS